MFQSRILICKYFYKHATKKYKIVCTKVAVTYFPPPPPFVENFWRERVSSSQISAAHTNVI